MVGVAAKPGSATALVIGKRKPAGKKRPVKNAGRRAAQGATRNSKAAARAPRRSSAWLNRVLILLGAAIVTAAATKAYLTLQAIPVQRISVTGELEHTQAQAVQDLVQSTLAGGFLKADLQLMRRQLEGLPWIYQATVRRKWPNELEIHVLEQLPIARWGEDGFLNHKGGIFHPAKSGEWQSLPLLIGPQGTAQALMAKYQRLLGILAPLNLSVERLAMDERGQLEAELVGGMQLIVGSTDFLARMHRFVAIYRSELAERQDEIERVDLRYETGLAVAFSETSQVAGL